MVTDVCTGNAKCLQTFALEVFGIGYTETPDYEKMQDLLIDALDLEETPEEIEHNIPNKS